MRVLHVFTGLLAFVLGSAKALALAVSLPQPEEAIGTVGIDLSDVVSTSVATDQNNLAQLALASMESIIPIFSIAALLVITVTGLILIGSQDEGQLATARKTLLAAVSAMVLLNLSVVLSNAIWRGFDGGSTAGTYAASGQLAACTLSAEVFGLIDFIEEPLLIIAVLMIIVSGIRAVLNFGTDDGVAAIRRTVFAVLGGIIILLGKVVITRSFASLSPTAGTVTDLNTITVVAQDCTLISATQNLPVGFIEVVLYVLQIVLGFMALAAFVVVIIAGIIMILNFGNQETVTRARKIIVRSIIGLLIVLIAYGLVLAIASI